MTEGLFQAAIGESGGTNRPKTPDQMLDAAERRGSDFGETVNAPSLATLRALPAEDLAARPWKPSLAIDGYVETETVEDAYIAHHQRDIPVLLGWNADEGVDLAGLLAGLTGEKFRKALKEMFAPYPVPPGLEARYPSSTDEQTRVSKIRAMQDWMGYLMWHWGREQGSILSINSRSLVCSGPP